MPTPILLRRPKLGKGSCNGIAAASQTGLKPVRYWRRNDWPDEVGVVFRWGCTTSLSNFEGTVVNSASSIHWCTNKRESRLAMQAAGVPVPKTWGGFIDWENNSSLTLPVIVRRETHSQGRGLVVCRTWDDVWNATRAARWAVCRRHIPLNYISVIIPKVREYRVAVIQNRVAWVAEKTPADPSAIAWNVAQGGRFDNVRWNNWPLESIKAALAAIKLSSADFGGVDVIEDAEGKPYVLEINSAPSQTSPYRQSCFAKCFDWIVTHGKERFEDIPNLTRRNDIVHPALKITS